VETGSRKQCKPSGSAGEFYLVKLDGLSPLYDKKWALSKLGGTAEGYFRPNKDKAFLFGFLKREG
jgi:hypothetical protein